MYIRESDFSRWLRRLMYGGGYAPPESPSKKSGAVPRIGRIPEDKKWQLRRGGAIASHRAA